MMSSKKIRRTFVVLSAVLLVFSGFYVFGSGNQSEKETMEVNIQGNQGKVVVKAETAITPQERESRAL
ncbi:MAG: hypothetical protein ACLFTY_02545 [Candidatus Aenigmatarchaeota archaeon]